MGLREEQLAYQLKPALQGLGFENVNVSRDLGRGTAFPSTDITLASGDRFFRTDLGFACYYDGTRWLTVHEYQSDFTPYARTTIPFTGTSGTLLISPLRTDYNIYYTRARVYLDIVGTNNGTNYWSMALILFATTVWSFNTSADSAGVGITKEDTTAAAVTTGTYAKYDVTGKTGTPSGIVLNGTFWYRLVIV